MLFFDLKSSEKKYFEQNDVSDFEITFFRESLNENTKLTVNECDETAIISIYTNSLITNKVLDKFKNLQIIAIRSNRYDNIDIKFCRARNIAVVNICDNQNTSVAQYVLGMTFMLERNIPKSINDFKSKINRYEEYEGRDLRNLSIGVIGTGIIGSSVCRLAHTLGLKVYGYDILINKDLQKFVEYLPLIDVLRKSDIITLHLPYSKDLYHFISEDEFKIMKNNAVLINTSHGSLTDTKALYNAIKTKQIKGVALDVIECENKYYDINSKDTDTKNYAEILLLLKELTTFDNVIITSGISQNTIDSVNNKLRITFNNIADFYKGGHMNRAD